MAYQTQQLAMLAARVSEIEWYARQHNLVPEPHLYPKGLFKAQTDVVGRYQLSAYVNELKQDLYAIEQQTLALLGQKRSQLLLQKINVLINSFRSQTLRKKNIGSMDGLLGQIDLTSDSAYDYFAKKQKPDASKKLKIKIKNLQKDLLNLQQSKKQKERELQTSQTSHQKDHCKAAVLSIAKQIGCLEQEICRLKEAIQ